MIFRSLSELDADYLDSAKNTDFADGWNKDMVLSAISGGRFFGFIAQENNVPVAFITYSISYDDADIESVYVNAQNRKKGIAKELISLVEKNVASLGKQKLFLEVKENNLPAINLYLSAGFNKISIRKKYYADGSNAIVMQKEL